MSEVSDQVKSRYNLERLIESMMGLRPRQGKFQASFQIIQV